MGETQLTSRPDPASNVKFGNLGGEDGGRGMTWVNAQGSGKRLPVTRGWEEILGGWEACVCFSYLQRVAVKSLLSAWVCAHSCWRWGTLTRGARRRGAARCPWVRGRPSEQGARGDPQLWLVPLSPHVHWGCASLDRTSWPYAPRAGTATFVLPKKHNEEERAAVLKAVQRGFGCSVLIKNWWENRCLNPGFGVINLPAPNTGKRESRERQMPLQLTKTS